MKSEDVTLSGKIIKSCFFVCKECGCLTGKQKSLSFGLGVLVTGSAEMFFVVVMRPVKVNELTALTNKHLKSFFFVGGGVLQRQTKFLFFSRTCLVFAVG